MEFKMHLAEKPFYMIKSGKQDIAIRLYDEKRQKIKVGDTIEFSNVESGQTVETSVVGIHTFKNFKELYKEFDKTRLGYLDDENANPSDMNKFYSDSEIEKYGVVGIEISLK